MKIGIVMPLAEQRGGAELSLLHLMQQGRNAGIDWTVIFLEDGPMVADIQGLGVKSTVVKAGRVRQLHRFAAAVARIAAIARSEGIDLLLGWMPKAHLYAGPASMLAGIPAIWYHVGIPAHNSTLDRIIDLLPARGILTVSQAARRAQVRLTPTRPVRLVYPGVELDRFDPGRFATPRRLREQLGLPAEGPLIGIVARLQRWKGIHVLIEALPVVLRVYPDTFCLIVGGEHPLEPDYTAYLESRIDALELRERVIMAGFQHNIPDWMQAMDVVVHASASEPFGIVILEAMALGKPVVAGNAGGPTEIITDGVDGLLSPYEDAPGLARQILRFLDDAEFARSVGAAAQERARAFSTESFARNLISALRDLLSPGPP